MSCLDGKAKRVRDDNPICIQTSGSRKVVRGVYHALKLWTLAAERERGSRPVPA